MDFTYNKFSGILKTLLSRGYEFQTLEQFCQSPVDKTVILRHDVDKYPEHSVHTATLEKAMGIKGTYYFRIVKQSNHPELISQIAKMGHEIGYHYEDLTLAKGDVNHAYELFNTNLEYFRKYYPVKTICMHGSPTSKWDNRDLETLFI